MSTLSSKLGLLLPDGTDLIDRTNQLNGNWEILDDATGMITCTSTTRPSNPHADQLIYETDTRRIMLRNTTDTAWTGPINGIPVVNNDGDVTDPYNGQVVFNLTAWSLKVFRGSTGAWELQPNTIWKYKPATESVTNSTTLQDDDVFSFPVVASSAWALEGFVPYDGAQAPAGGLKTTFAGPAGASMYYTNFGTPDAASGSLALYNMVAQGLTGTRDMGTQVTATATMCFQPKGVLVVGVTAGTLQFRWAQTTSNGTATRILGGSWMKLTRIA